MTRTVACLLVLTAVGAWVGLGCSKSVEVPKTDDKALIGTWIEIPPASVPAGGRRPPPRHPNNLRQITFNSDHTYKLIVCKKDGAPVDATKAIEGTWKVEENDVKFQVTKNTVDKAFADLEPQEFAGLQKTPTGMQMSIVDKAETAVFKPAGK